VVRWVLSPRYASTQPAIAELTVVPSAATTMAPEPTVMSVVASPVSVAVTLASPPDSVIAVVSPLGVLPSAGPIKAAVWLSPVILAVALTPSPVKPLMPMTSDVALAVRCASASTVSAPAPTVVPSPT